MQEFTALRKRYIFLYLFTVAAFVPAVRANLFRDNPDRPVDRRRILALNAIGRIETIRDEKNEKGQIGHGAATAFLISPCFILTNNHAVFGADYPSHDRVYQLGRQDRQEWQDKYAVTFSVGIGESSPFAYATRAIPVDWGDRHGANRNDWALLKLDECLGLRKEIGWLVPDMTRDSSKITGLEVHVVGYPAHGSGPTGENPGQTLYMGNGKVTGYNTINNTVAYSASTGDGSSGAPVFTLGSDGRLNLIGMHRSGGRVSKYAKHYTMETLQIESYASFDVDHANEFLNIRDVIESNSVRGPIVDDIRSHGVGDPNLVNQWNDSATLLKYATP